MKSNAIIGLLVTLLFLGCTKQDLPTPINQEPQIWVAFKLNGTPIKYMVGDSASFACPTINNSSMTLDVRQFISEIKSEVDNISLKFTINNRSQQLGTIQNDMENTIKTGVFNYTYTYQYPNYYYINNEVIITLIDNANKNVYSTLPKKQGQKNNFEIVSVKDVEDNGKKYKLAEVKFSCIVKHIPTGYWYEISEGHGFIPFGEE